MNIQDYQDLLEGKDREIKFLLSAIKNLRAENEKLKRDINYLKGHPESYTSEIWKDISGFEGIYQISNYGRVKSNKGFKALILHKDGYYRVGLNRDKKTVTRLVHKLVWDTFSDIKSENYVSLVDHKDNDKTNNHFSNLQLLPNRENVAKHYMSENKKTSKYTGVCFHKARKKWLAQYKTGNKTNYIGYFNNEHDAHLAYQNAINSLQNTSL